MIYCSFRSLRRIFLCALVLAIFSQVKVIEAASIRGTVTDQRGAAVRGAQVLLVLDGKVVNVAVTGSDGSYQVMSGASGHYVLLVKATSFRQLKTPDFYAGALDNIERKLVVEPEWVHESIVVTATGTPTPQSQTVNTTSVLGPNELANYGDVVNLLRTTPGTSVQQTGQRGSQTSLFVRGGDSTGNKALIDGQAAGDIGDGFDFSSISTTAKEQVEIYRGPNVDLFGQGAGSSVINFTTPHGTTSFPSLLAQGETGNFYTSREQLELAGTHKKLDYYGAYSWFQTSNSLPHDQYHVGTAGGNFGWQPNGNTEVRGTALYGVDGVGLPNAYAFYGISDHVTERDQDLYFGGILNNQTTVNWRNHLQIGVARKREQTEQAEHVGTCYPVGTCLTAGEDGTVGEYYGLPVTIHGANGYKATGPALIDYSEADYTAYPNKFELVNERNLFAFETQYQVTPHLGVVAGVHAEGETGVENFATYAYKENVNHTNVEYNFGAHGDFKNRFFYTLGAGIGHYDLYGSTFSPRLGGGYYVVLPRPGFWSGTRLNFSFAKGEREVNLYQELGSLYQFLENHGGQSTISSYGIGKIEQPTSRTWEGGVQQAFLTQHIIWRVNFFHNEFGRGVEYVAPSLVPSLLPNLTPAEQQQLEAILKSDYAYGLYVNSLDFRALGIETTLEGGIGHSVFLRGGYTYLDTVVQHSFSSDQASSGAYPITFDGIPVGGNSPLQGARVFRRPPHTGYFSASYNHKGFAGAIVGTYQSRADDSTYLVGMDLNGGNSLVLPNRNLDPSFFRLDMGASYQILSWLGYYIHGENLTSNQHVAPVGYLSLPANFVTGLKFRVGGSKK